MITFGMDLAVAISLPVIAGIVTLVGIWVFIPQAGKRGSR